MEHPPVKDTLEQLGTTKVAKAMGFPISTINEWKTNDKIPGKGPLKAFRVSKFKEAIKIVARASKKGA